MADISKIKLPNNVSYDVKDTVARSALIHYIKGPSTDTTAGIWTGVDSSITEYYDGLSILYVPAVAGASTTTLNINNIGAVQCYTNGTTALTTQYPIGTPILFTYYGGKWRRADYSTNTTGSTDTSSKIFLIGATSQAENSQTYSDNEVYATSGVLTTKSVQVGGGAATMQFNNTTKSIDFVFT